VNNDKIVVCFYCEKIVPKKSSWGIGKIRACRNCAKKARDNPLGAVKDYLGTSKEITKQSIEETATKISGNKRKLKKMKKIAKMFGYNSEELRLAKEEMGIKDYVKKND
jgi:hypothetical protein